MKRNLVRLVRCGLLATMMLSFGVVAVETSFDSGLKRVSVIELFTSQGCSSCPPAETWLSRFKGDPELWKRVVPLAFHVDYWDSLGWKDPFASSDHSQRQYQYKRKGGLSSVYTPGILVNGKEWRGWVCGREPPFPAGDAGRLTLSLEGRRLTAAYKATQGAAKTIRLSVAILAFGLSTQVERGENRGRQLAQEFVVVGLNEGLSDTQIWDMALPDLIDHSASRHALVAWVSDAQQPTPLQATGGWLPRVVGSNLLPGTGDARSGYAAR